MGTLLGILGAILLFLLAMTVSAFRDVLGAIIIWLITIVLGPVGFIFGVLGLGTTNFFNKPEKTKESTKPWWSYYSDLCNDLRKPSKPPAEPVVSCRSCGRQAKPGAKYCTHCGAKLPGKSCIQGSFLK
jgi:hypothetical protein